LAAKQKTVDTIAAPASPSVMPAKAEIQDVEAPLLSILEPAVARKSKKIKREKNNYSSSEVEKTAGSSSSQESNNITGFWPRHRKTILITISTIGVILLTSGLLVGGAYAYEQQYKGKIFPGVKVWGVEVGGKNTTELQQLITDKIKSYQLTLKGPDQDYLATAEDLGVNYDTEATITKALSNGRESSIVQNNLMRVHLLATLIVWEPWQKLIRANNLVITPSIVVNDEKLNQYVTKIADKCGRWSDSAETSHIWTCGKSS
jgi:hypothetical protein